MKKILLTLSIAIASHFCYAQWNPGSGIITTTDNVGIGTTTPLNKFSVIGNANFGATGNSYVGQTQYGALEFPRGEIIFSNTNTQDQLYMISNAYLNAGGSFLYRNTGPTAGVALDAGGVSLLTAPSSTAGSTAQFVNRLTVLNNGNVGIGTANPVTSLHVAGATNGYGTILSTVTPSSFSNGLSSGLGYSLVSNTSFSNNGAWSNIGLIQNSSNANDVTAGVHLALFGWYQNSGQSLPISLGGGFVGVNPSIYIASGDAAGGGNVGIGTITPDEKLTVNGVIHSTEVKVTSTVPVPDYVFGPDYKLTGLGELKDYLDKNHHLPEIPSAKTIEKDGISLGDMNLKLLKKVEELTLYLIEQQKINQSLQTQIDQLAKKN